MFFKFKNSFGDGWSTGSYVTFTVSDQIYGPYSIPAHSGSRIYLEQTEQLTCTTSSYFFHS